MPQRLLFEVTNASVVSERSSKHVVSKVGTAKKAGREGAPCPCLQGSGRRGLLLPKEGQPEARRSPPPGIGRMEPTLLHTVPALSSPQRGLPIPSGGVGGRGRQLPLIVLSFLLLLRWALRAQKSLR